MNRVLFGDCRESLRQLAADGVRAQMCVTSPPYFGLRDYGVAGQLGLEQTPEEYVAGMVEVFRGVRDVLADDGTLWLNIGDSYANDGKWGGSSGGKHAKALHGDTGVGRRKVHTGLKPKDLIGIPWMLAFALRADGWYLRQEIIWHKPNPMPESVRDRCTKAHESIFLLSKSPRYFIDQDGIREPAVSAWSPEDQKMPDGWDTGPGAHGAFHRQGREKGRRTSMRNSFARASKNTAGEHGQKPQHRPGRDEVHYDRPTRNRRSVWTIPTRPYKGAHFAVFPAALIEPCVLAGSRPGDVVLDPFMGSGTTAQVAIMHGRQYLGCELNAGYKPLQDERIAAAMALVRDRDAQLRLFDAA